MLHVAGEAGRTELPMALAADLDPHARMTEPRIYFSRWPLSGVRGVRPPLLQPDPDLQAPDVVGEYHRAPAAGDVDAVAGGVRTGWLRPRAVPAGLTVARTNFVCSTSGSSPMAVGRASSSAPWPTTAALRAGVQRRCSGPEGVAARSRHRRHVRGEGARLAAVRIYDDVHPSLSRHLQQQARTESRDETCMSR